MPRIVPLALGLHWDAWTCTPLGDDGFGDLRPVDIAQTIAAMSYDLLEVSVGSFYLPRAPEPIPTLI